MAQLIPSLTKLRAEFNALNPSRDKASDGWIGDPAHQATNSDHNPDGNGDVHAIDVDETGPWPNGITMEKMVQFILARCRSGAEARLKYIIYERRIWSASSSWAQQSYSGGNPHDQHAHFSGSYTNSHEASTASWHLEDLNMPSAEEIADAVVAKMRQTPDVLSDTERLKIAAQARIAVKDHKEIDPNITVANGYTQAQVDAEAASPTLRIFGALRMMNFRDNEKFNWIHDSIQTIISKIDAVDDPGLAEIMDKLEEIKTLVTPAP